jgi:hypothetical protein
VGLILASVARPCCLLPLGLSLFGLGYSELAHRLEPLRGMLVGAAVLSLGLSGALTFRRGTGWLPKLAWLVSAAVLAHSVIPHRHAKGHAGAHRAEMHPATMGSISGSNPDRLECAG